MKVTLDDFTGGLTDAAYDSPDNCATVLDNWLIQKDGNIETCPGMEVFSSDAYRVPSNTRISKLAKVGGEYVAFSGKKLYHVTSSAVTEVTGPVDNNDAFNNGDADSLVSVAELNGHIIATNDARSYPIKIWKDGSNVIRLVTAGLPRLASDPTITPVAGSNSWIYAFVLKYEYTVGTVTHIDRGPRRLKQVTSANTNVSITNIPVLSNGSDYNYDTASIKVEIYRTTNGGSTYYYVGEVTNGTTSFSDTVSDANLILNEPLYTNGGVLDNDPPPPCKYVWESNGTLLYGDVLDGAVEHPNRYIQSVAGDGDSVPEDFFGDLSGSIKGGGNVGRTSIIFTDSSTIRREGSIDETGRGTVYTEVLSNSVGCVAMNSIVRGKAGLYFASEDGFYFTDGSGFPRKLAGRPNNPFASKIDAIYADLQDKEKIHGAYDAANKRILWSVVQSESDNDVIFVYYEEFDSFSTLSNEGGILPTALLQDSSTLLIGDSNGYLFKMSEDMEDTHPVVSVGDVPSTWNTTPIIYRWKSINHGLGDGSVNKWINKINVQGTPDTNLDMAIYSYTNGEPEYKELYPLKLSSSLTWGDSNFTWGDESLVWNRTSTMNQTRRFPKGRLRARHRAIEFTNAYAEIQSSTDSTDSYVTVNGTTNTATLVTPATYAFGTDYEGYDLLIDGTYYEITNATADTLTVTDPDNTLPTGTYAWSVWGYPKGQRAHILNFSIEYETMTDAGTYYKEGAG